MKNKNTSIINSIKRGATRALTVVTLAGLLLVLPPLSSTSNAMELREPEAGGPGNGELNDSDIRLKLYESYNSDYDMYEESMDDMFFFYCNVGNGSFTSDPVKFEFPNNITYVVEKDGTAYTGDLKKGIKDVGNYVIRVTAKQDGTTYYSTFRFALKEKAGGDTAGDDDANKDNSNNGNSDDKKSGDEGGLNKDDLVIDPNDEVSDEDVRRIIEKVGGDMYTPGQDEAIEVNQYSGLATAFDHSTMLYNMTLKTGDVIISNVPNGAVVNSSIILSVPDSISVEIYKDGVSVTKNQTLNFVDPGFYKVVFSSDKTNFYRYYTDEDRYPFMTFRVLGDAVNDIDVFTAPEGCKITAITTDDGVIRNEDGTTDVSVDSYWLENEGTYLFTVYDSLADASYKVSIVKDVTAPEGSLDVAKSVASLSLESKDVANVEVFRDGVAQNYSWDKITGKGNYVVNIYDVAGNVTTLTFHLDAGFNMGTFATIFLVLVIIITLFVFVRLHRTKVTVR